MGLVESMRPPAFLVQDESGAILLALFGARELLQQAAVGGRPCRIVSIVVPRARWESAQRSRATLSTLMGEIVGSLREAPPAPRPARPARVSRSLSPRRRVLRARR